MADKKQLTLREKAEKESEEIKKQDPKYYNSEQSAKDVKAFIDRINAKHEARRNNKWHIQTHVTLFECSVNVVVTPFVIIVINFING